MSNVTGICRISFAGLIQADIADCDSFFAGNRRKDVEIKG
jgi:hypothetical protein